MEKHAFFLVLALALGIAAGRAATLPDSLVSIDKVYEYTFSDPDRAEAILDALRDRQRHPDAELDRTAGDFYFNTGSYYHAIDNYRRLLENPAVLADDTLHMEALHRMISCYDALHQVGNLTRYVKQLLQKARQCSNEAMQSVALFNMGKILYNQGLKDEGYRDMEQAVELMEQSDYPYKYDNLRYNYNVLVLFLEEDKRYEEELRMLDKLESIASTSTGEERYAMQEMDKKELKPVYAHRATVLNRLGRTDEAEEAYHQFLEVADVFSRDNYLIMPYLSDLHRYDDIIRMNRHREQAYRKRGDTISYHMRTIKRSLAHAYWAKGDWRTAAGLYADLASITDSIKEREQQSAAVELAAVYDLHEKNQRIMEQETTLQRRNLLIVGLTGGFLLVGVLLVVVWMSRRRIGERNAALAARVDELVHTESLLQAERSARVELEDRLARLPQPPAPPSASPTEPEADVHQQENRILFQRMDAEVREHKLYLDPDFGRDQLTRLARVDKNRLAEIIRDNTAGNLSDYLNNIRVAHAIGVMRRHTRYTLHAVAGESGFGNMTTFTNAFKRYTGLTPAQYRKAKLGKADA